MKKVITLDTSIQEALLILNESVLEMSGKKYGYDGTTPFHEQVRQMVLDRVEIPKPLNFATWFIGVELFDQGVGGYNFDLFHYDKDAKKDNRVSKFNERGVLNRVFFEVRPTYYDHTLPNCDATVYFPTVDPFSSIRKVLNQRCAFIVSRRIAQQKERLNELGKKQIQGNIVLSHMQKVEADLLLEASKIKS